jgi:hypothetical protein
MLLLQIHPRPQVDAPGIRQQGPLHQRCNHPHCPSPLLLLLLLLLLWLSLLVSGGGGRAALAAEAWCRGTEPPAHGGYNHGWVGNRSCLWVKRCVCTLLLLLLRAQQLHAADQLLQLLLQARIAQAVCVVA